MEMIVLRSGRAVVEDPYTAPVAVHDPLEVSLEVEDLSGKDLVEMRRDPTILEAAPPMPTQLIRPVGESRLMAAEAVQLSRQDETPSIPTQLIEPVAASTVPAIPPMSWGVAAVKADVSKFSGAGVTVAILDTGIDQTHPAFKGIDTNRNNFKNFTTEVDQDIDGHGTHCAGTIFGRAMSACRIGVAPGVERALIGKVIGKGGGSTDAIYKAILWASQNGAHVISMSLGMDFPAYRQRLAASMPETVATSMALVGYRANVRLFDRLSQITSARDNVVPGSVVVAAAGNESKRPDYRIAVAPPAAAEQFLSVAALGQIDAAGKTSLTIAGFSNSGARLSAPGVDIWSAKLGGGLTLKSGTSMATPHVAGVAALWAEKLMGSKKSFQASRVIEQIERAAQDLSSYLDPDDTGLGLVQAP
jgi:hypothetical protein